MVMMTRLRAADVDGGASLCFALHAMPRTHAVAINARTRASIVPRFAGRGSRVRASRGERLGCVIVWLPARAGKFTVALVASGFRRKNAAERESTKVFVFYASPIRKVPIMSVPLGTARRFRRS